MNRKSICLLAAVCELAMLAASVAGQPSHTNTPSGTPGERILLVVETSRTMQPRAANLEKMLGSVIAGGMKGEFTPNSSIGVWTFNEQLQTGKLPVQVWNDSTRQKVARTVVDFLQQQRFEKAPRLEEAWQAATNIVARSGHITLLLVTSGDDWVKGTPFDETIADTFSKNAEEQRRNQMPFLTILRAVDGSFVSYAVNMPPWPLEVPAYPEGMKPKVAPPPAATLKPKPAPIVLTPTNVVPPGSTPTPTSIVVVGSAATNAPGATPVAAAPQLKSNELVTADLKLPVASDNQSENAAGTASASSSTNSPVATAGITTSEGSPFRRPIVIGLLVGIGVLSGLLLVFLVLLRKAHRAAGESLITRSMNERNR